MEFTPQLNARDLSKLAEEAIAVGKTFLEDPMGPTDDEISEANHVLRSHSNALKCLGYANIRSEEMPAAWLEVARSTGELLVREDTIGEYWKEAALDFGRLTKDQHEEFSPVIDWVAYAQNQDAVIIDFSNVRHYGIGGKEINYYIF